MSDATTTMKVPPYSNNSGELLVPTCILGAVALVLVILRISTRLNRTGRLFFDDWVVIIAEGLSLPWFGLAGAAVHYGWGKPYAYLTPYQFDMSMKMQFVLQTIWILSLCFARLSVAATLLRFGQEKYWRIPLYIIMGLQSLISSSYVVIQFAQCTPFSYPWDIQPGVKCWDVKHIINYGWVIAVVYTLFDLTLALMPIRMIRTLSRPISEKILIGFLMALGLLATGVAGAKMSTFTKFGQGDPMQASILPSLLSKLEEIVGIIAVSLPCLKSPTQRVLKKFGLLKSHQLTRPSFVDPPEDYPQMEQDRRSSGEGSSGSQNVKGFAMTNVEHVNRNDSGRAV